MTHQVSDFSVSDVKVPSLCTCYSSLSLLALLFISIFCRAVRATQSAVMPQYVVCPSVRDAQVGYRDHGHVGWNTS